MLLLVFFIVVCGYADRPRFDNEEDDKPIFDNGGDNYEDTKIYKEYTEAYEEATEAYKKTRFGARIGLGAGSFVFGKKETNYGMIEYELGGSATIPLLKKAGHPYIFALFNAELNYIRRKIIDVADAYETAISIPLLLQVVFVPPCLVQEIGTIFDFPLHTEYNESPDEKPEQYRKSFDPGFVYGLGIRIKNFIVGFRTIYYPGFDEFDNSKLAIFNLGTSYLF